MNVPLDQTESLVFEPVTLSLSQQRSRCHTWLTSAPVLFTPQPSGAGKFPGSLVKVDGGQFGQ